MSKTRKKKEKAEKRMAKMEQGIYPTWLRKVKRHLHSANSLFEVAVIRGNLHYHPKKYHLRLRERGKKKYAQPNQKCQAMRQRLSDRLSYLKHHEEKLRRKLEKRMKK